MTSTRLWTCVGCGKVALWGPTWGWYGSLKDLDDSNIQAVACSDACKPVAIASYGGKEKKKVKSEGPQRPISPERAFKMLRAGIIDKEQFDRMYEAWENPNV